MRIRAGAGEALGPLQRARAEAMYLLSLHAAANVVVAFVPEPSSYPLVFTVGAALLAASLVLGEAAAPWLSALADRAGRGRLRLAAWVPYGGLLLLAFVGTSDAAQAETLQGVSLALALLQPVFLALASLGRGYIGAIQNAFVLVVLASLRGGLVAAVAVVGYVAFLGTFLVFDHYARKLAAYRAGGEGVLRAAFAQAAMLVGPAVAALALFFALVPPAPYRRLVGGPVREISPEELASAYRDLALLALFCGAVVYFAVRILLRDRGGQGAPVLEVPAARRGAEEKVRTRARRREASYPGARGRIVRAYVRFAAQAARVGLPRRPDLTPREFAARVAEPAKALEALTERFMDARYGSDEPTEADAAVAERSSEAVVAALRERRGPRG